MLRGIAMSKEMPEGAPGIEREKNLTQSDFFSELDSRVFPAHPQQSFGWLARERVKATTTKFYALMGAMFRKWAEKKKDPLEAFAGELDKKPSYASKISEAFNRRDNRHVPIDFAPPLLLGDERAASIWMEFWSEELGYEPPVKKRVVTKEADDAATHDVLNELPEPLQEMIRREKAKKLGVRPDEVKL